MVVGSCSYQCEMRNEKWETHATQQMADVADTGREQITAFPSIEEHDYGLWNRM